jgi:long-chain-acyl-CoA dehydrogenase
MLIPRTLFSEEHAIFRDSVRKFLQAEIAPHHARWEHAGIVDRSAWLAAGKQGLLCMTAPEEYGGQGVSRLYSAILLEEMTRLSLTGPGFHIHSDIVGSYIAIHGDAAQKETWLPRMARGEAIGGIAMSEPSGGSDLQAMRTTASREGDVFVLNGQKTFISNGQLADLLVVAAKTDSSAGAKGITLFLVDTARDGFIRGRNLEKMGIKAQDTSEIFFDQLRVPATSVLGGVGQGFTVLMQELAWERMMMAIRAVATCEAALEWTVAHAKERTAFGKALIDMQYNRFKLAEHKARAQMARVYVDRCIELLLEGALDATTAAAAKMLTTELTMNLLDDCVQIHGGYGYMWEYPICRAYADNRYTRIAGGTNEIMRELIARSL